MYDACYACMVCFRKRWSTCWPGMELSCLMGIRVLLSMFLLMAAQRESCQQGTVGSMLSKSSTFSSSSIVSKLFGPGGLDVADKGGYASR